MSVHIHRVGDSSACRSSCCVMQSTTQVCICAGCIGIIIASQSVCYITVYVFVIVDQRDYICEFCARAFKSSHNLAVHRMIHTGEKPLQLVLCLNSHLTGVFMILNLFYLFTLF